MITETLMVVNQKDLRGNYILRYENSSVSDNDYVLNLLIQY
jgi:hypothetical protein